jgi:hypothetical protein
MLICLFILCIQHQVFFDYDTGRMEKMRTYILHHFGDPNIKDVKCGDSLIDKICEVKFGKNMAAKTFKLLAAQVLKPVFVMLVRAFNGEMANS